MRRFVFALLVSFALAPAAMAKDLSPEETKGKTVYEKRCIHCHGVKGKGDGPAADRLRPRPRSFKVARYKFSEVMFGKLPQDKLIIRWVTEGLPGSSMPGWKDILSTEEIKNVVAYIKTFTKKFAKAAKKGRAPKPITIGEPPKWTEDDIAKGKELFLKNCEKCHGKEGRGSGATAIALKHDLGDRIWPRNLTKGWMFRGGNGPKDIFRTIATGITGTPMPAHIGVDGEKGAMTEPEIWQVVGFVDSIIRRARPQVKEVVVSRFVEGDISTDPYDESWNQMEARYFPMVSNIIEGERFFKTTIESVFVRSVYNGKEIAINVEWDDRSMSPLPEPNPKFPANRPDSVLVQLPPEIPTGMEKPYFLGGNESSPVVLWQWTNGGKANVLTGKGILKVENKGEEAQVLKATAKYSDGQWRVVFIRPIESKVEGDLNFEIGKYIPIAFSAWDGNNDENNEKRAISIWYWLLLEPPKSLTVYVFPALIGLLIVGGEVLLIRKSKNNV